VGAVLGGLWAWHNRVTIRLRSRLRNLNLKSQFLSSIVSEIYSYFRDIHVHINDFLRFVGGLWALRGVANR